jgi:nicotinamide-nucleotide amidase
VTYRRGAKHRLLGVPDGPVVSRECARTMATGVAELFDTDLAVATTGVAGPDTQDGQPVGTVWLGWTASGRSGAVLHRFEASEPDRVRADAVEAAIELLVSLVLDQRPEMLGPPSIPPPGPGPAPTG